MGAVETDYYLRISFAPIFSGEFFQLVVAPTATQETASNTSWKQSWATLDGRYSSITYRDRKRQGL